MFDTLITQVTGCMLRAARSLEAAMAAFAKS